MNIYKFIKNKNNNYYLENKNIYTERVREREREYMLLLYNIFSHNVYHL